MMRLLLISTVHMTKSSLSKACLQSFSTLLTVLSILPWMEVPAAEPVSFVRDIRPVLSDKCFACHGPDENGREADLRLDVRDAAIEYGAIEAGSATDSLMIERILEEDDELRMPPPQSHKVVSAEELKLIKRWIDEGARYETHWSYAPLNFSEHRTAEDQNQIDRFIERRIADAGFEVAPEADRITLIRRLTQDLTGLPPTVEEVTDFLNDHSEYAYERLVDRLLSSPRYGERMAVYWLDLVRYADTVGYHSDQDITQWLFRDYVISAFNDNLPYDRFVLEQLAGDLLPNATTSQLVASGYNRLNQTTAEGGAQAKEYLTIYLADRVRNVSQVFMGATMGCCQCHDHKYDPYTLRDFYAMGAFFADLEEHGVYSRFDNPRPPTLRVFSREDKEQLAELEQQVLVLRADRESRLRDPQLIPAEWEAEILEERSQSVEVTETWIDDEQNIGGRYEGDWKFVSNQRHPVYSGEKSRLQNGIGTIQHFFLNAKSTVEVEEDTTFFTWVYLDPELTPTAIMLQFNDGNWDHRAVWGSADIPFGRRSESWAGNFRYGKTPKSGEWVRLEASAKDLGLVPGDIVNGMAFTQFGGLAYWDAAGWITSGGVPSQVVEALTTSPEFRNADEKKNVRQYYLRVAKPLLDVDNLIAKLQAQKKQIEEAAPVTPISKSVKPRAIRILPRGNWQDDSGEIVDPAIPSFLGELQTGDNRATRIDLANWLCESNNVLTSRTMVNRLWYLLFGRGICSSIDDLGGQGTYPSHPELLDWLAADFVESGWDIKQIIRKIVLSKAYRRPSKPTTRLLEEDPQNQLLARQGRFPLAAEMVRDGALSISGLLVEKVGGPSVKPYQPEGYLNDLIDQFTPRKPYRAERDDNQYRRGVYTHWQRTFLHPMLKAFDAPSREECTAGRTRSNTPLQALVLLNDPTFVEAARVFADRIMKEGGESSKQKSVWAYKVVTSREPTQLITDELLSTLHRHLEHFRSSPEQAELLVSIGNTPIKEHSDLAELAAWTNVARILLNLHETITRY